MLSDYEELALGVLEHFLLVSTGLLVGFLWFFVVKRRLRLQDLRLHVHSIDQVATQLDYNSDVGSGKYVFEDRALEMGALDVSKKHQPGEQAHSRQVPWPLTEPRNIPLQIGFLSLFYDVYFLFEHFGRE